MKGLARTLNIVIEQEGVLFYRRDCEKQYSIFFSSEAFDKSSVYIISFFFSEYEPGSLFYVRILIVQKVDNF